MEAGRGAPSRVLVLGAGAAQLGLLRAARSGGLYVVAADRDFSAPGLRLADRATVVSAEDEEAVDRLAREERVDGLERTVAWYRDNEAWWRSHLGSEAVVSSS